MSRLAKKSIPFGDGVTVALSGSAVTVKGQKGEISLTVLPHITVSVEGGTVTVASAAGGQQGVMNAGTMWSLVRNAVQGVHDGFLKVLEIEGVGYRAAMEGDTLSLSLGYVNPVKFKVPAGAAVTVEKNTIKIAGINKEVVGSVASKIRAFKKPEPYKGKGIRYQGEVIKRKVGKKAATAAA